jgi:outer membrane protein OmpA-like peptidoglycan-associated protein
MALFITRFGRLAVATLLLGTTSLSAAADECTVLVTRFETAVAEKAIDKVKRAVGDITNDFVCGERAQEFKLKHMQFLIGLGESASSTEERSRALKEAGELVRLSGTWRQAAALGDAYFRQGDRPRAFSWYEQSVSFLTSRPGTAASAAEKQALAAKAGAAKSGSSEEGRARDEWRQSTRDLDGRLGGIYSPGLVREVEVLSVPLPIRFDTDQATFTPEGVAAVEELAKAAKEQQVRALKLVGHADPRGTASHNLDLSKRRVEAVRKELQRLGVKARVDIDWKGSSEPFDIAVLPYQPGQEEAWALDRRGEWVRDGTAE